MGAERRLPGGRSAAFQAALRRRTRRQDAGGAAGWKPALREAARLREAALREAALREVALREAARLRPVLRSIA